MPNKNLNNRERPYGVLLVEDNADDMELCLRVLQKMQVDMGVEINARGVSDSTQASALVKEQKFDVIFLDVGMPPPDGIEVTKRIRNSEINRTTPIVIITGAEERGLMARAFQAGANLFLFKPIDRTRLIRIMQVARVPIDRERRRLQRVKVKCKVSLESDQGSLEGETLDLSLSGMLVHASHALPVGSSVKVNLTLPPATAPIRIVARVVRLVGNELMGLQLEHIGKAETDKLGEFLVPLIVRAIDRDK